MILYRVILILVFMPIVFILGMVNIILVGIKYMATGKGVMSDKPTNLINDLLDYAIGINSLP